MYIVIKDYKKFDEYFIPCEMRDGTWKEALDIIESALDDRYINSDGKFEDIELRIRFQKELPEDAVED